MELKATSYSVSKDKAPSKAPTPDTSAPLDARHSGVLTGGPSFPLRHRLQRGLWNVSWFVLAAWTPPALHGWRRFLLRLFGASMAPGSRVYASARIWYPPNLVMEQNAVLGREVICYAMSTITLGRNAIVSQRSHLCAGTHDIDDPNFQLLAKPITIGANAWIAAEAFVGPGVTVGEGAVLGARGVAMKNLDPWTVYVGNPARRARTRNHTAAAD
jgi:putative colanic acid biosynthesis acetyltransferase WcaF